MIKNFLLTGLILFLTLQGCVNKAQVRTDELQLTINDMAMQKQTKDDAVRRWGVPTKCVPLSSGEICEWNRDLGVVGGTVPIMNLRTGRTLAYKHTGHSAFEKVTLEFDSNGYIVSGNSEVQY